MVYLATCDAPFSLDELAARIRKSSNFRFCWQFFHCGGIDPQSTTDIRQALEAIIATPELHEFLQESFEPMYAEAFEVTPLHEHCCVISATGELENTLACAANDHLGAYSQTLRDATAAEAEEIENLFGSIGQYCGYQLLPSSGGRHNDHVFSSWFFGIAWDWCLFAFWPHRNLLWVGCLTDTD